MRRSTALTGVLLGLVLSVSIAGSAFASGSGVAYAPPFGAWGVASSSGVGVFGHPGYRQGYSWSVQFGSETQVCMQAWGFNAAHPRGAWFGAGCGSSGSTSVPWGNVLASPRMRAKSYTIFGAFVPWRH
jgi:hypothetical protein